MAEKINIVQLYKMCAEIAKEINKKAGQTKEPINESDLAPLTEIFEKVMDFIKAYLIMAEDAFYGAMLSGMDTEIDYTIRSTVDVDVTNSNIFKLTFNPLFAYQYSFPELVGLVVGEILKVAYTHPALYSEMNSEADDEKHKKLEKSSSASVSNMIQHDIQLTKDGCGSGLRLPKDVYTTTTLNEEISMTPQLNQSLEYYYALLNRYQKKDNDNQKGNSQQSSKMQMPANTQGQGQSGNGQQSQDQNQSQQNQNQQQNQGQGKPSNQGGQSGNENKPASPDNNDGKQPHRWEQQTKTPSETREACKNLVDSAYRSLTDKQRGLMPAGLQQQIKALLAPPEIPWQKILENLAGAIPVPYRKTRTRLNRRQPLRSDLSGRLPKRIVKVVIVFDTSGSMSDECLRYCFNEVLNILKKYEGATITIVECDAEVGDVYKCGSMNEFMTKVSKKGVSGRGGTSFIPAIEFINGAPEYRKRFPGLSGNFKDALMIYFTDGYGDYEIPKPKTYRNLWVVLDDEKNLSVKNPYGQVKSLNTDASYRKLKKMGKL